VRNDTLETRRTVPVVRLAAALIQPACYKLDALDVQVTGLVWLVLVPHVDDRLGLLAAREELDGFLS
jgi:hypothetical protein